MHTASVRVSSSYICKTHIKVGQTWKRGDAYECVEHLEVAVSRVDCTLLYLYIFPYLINTLFTLNI